jgi:hypothetical protein
MMNTAAPAVDGHWLNAERVRVYSWITVVIFAGLFVVWLGRSLPALVDPAGKPFGYDFMAYWSAARLALIGQAAAAYNEPAIAAVQHAAVHALPGIVYPWHYPPTFLLPIAPLGLLPYPAALALFVLTTAVPWVALAGRMLPDRRAWIVAAAAPAGLITFLDGQNAFLTASIAGFALLWLDRRPVAAGVLIGLLAIKPQLALLFPLALLAERRWRSIAAATATVGALCCVSLAVFGVAAWTAFLRHLPVSQAMGDSGAVPWGTMPTAEVFFRSFGAPPTTAHALQAAVALFAAGCVWRAWRNPAAPFEAKAATLLAGSLLVSPYLFYYDLLWAALAIGWLTRLAMRDGFRRGEREIFLFAYAVPAVMQPVQMLTAVQPGFPAVLLLLVAAVRRAAPLSDSEWQRLRGVLTKPGSAMLPWLAVTALASFDFVMCRRVGWTISNWTAPALPSAFLALIALGYRWSGRSEKLAGAAAWLLLWSALSLSGVVLSYLGALGDRPTWDVMFARLDLALGFSWPYWFAFVVSHPIVHAALMIGYASMVPQIVLSTLYLAWNDKEYRIRELVLNSMIAMLITVVVFSLIPTLGPASAIPALRHAYDDYLAELMALREGSFTMLDLAHLKGIIAMPSYHTVMALLLTYVHRRSRLFLPALLLNGLLVLSIPIVGGHYVCDMIAGAAVTGLTLVVTGVVPRLATGAAPHRPLPDGALRAEPAAQLRRVESPARDS